MIMKDKMNIWQSLGLQGNYHILPNQFSSDSIIESNKIVSFLIKLVATMAYHPQGDGQMERANQELEQYLWLFK